MNTIFKIDTYSVTIQGCFEPFLSDNIDNNSEYDTQYDTQYETECDYDKDDYNEDELQQQEIDLADPINREINSSINLIKKDISTLANMKNNTIVKNIIDEAYKHIQLAQRMIIGNITKEENNKYPILNIDYINWEHIDALQNYSNDLMQFSNDLIELVIKMTE
jgi:hypothetical protein